MKLTKAQRELFTKWRTAPAKALIRWQGGFWTLDGTRAQERAGQLYKVGGFTVPVWYASTGTVRALVSRGLMTYTNATTARLTPAGAREMEACQMQSRVLAGGDIRHESPEERESPKEKNT